MVRYTGILILIYATMFIVLCFVFTGCSSPATAGELPLIVRIAESQIGKGEIGGNNKGKEVKKYTQGKEVAWCAGFVSWCRLKATRKPVPYYLSARSFWNENSNRVKLPKPGDVIYFKRGIRSGHVGIVESVKGRKITTIEGNVGPYPAKVKRVYYVLDHIPNLLGFVRI